MEHRQFGRTDMQVGVIGFGGAEIGYESAPQDDVDRLLGSALDTGLNVIDTAECYSDSEEKIGKAVSGRRSDFYLFTKCGHASGFEEADWDIAMLEKQIDRSLRRLKTDCIDLIELHTCDEDVLLQGEVIEVLQRAKQAGKTRYMGYSGDGDAARYAVSCGLFDALQISCNIADQESIETIGNARKAGMGVIAKRPIANVAWANGKDPGNYGHTYWQRLLELKYPFLDGTLSDAISTALRFTLGVEGVCTAIVGTKNPERWRTNAEIPNQGPLEESLVKDIVRRWSEVRQEDWVGMR